MLTYLRTHPDSPNIGIEIVHGNSGAVMVLGLAEIAVVIIKDQIINGPSEPHTPNQEQPPESSKDETNE